MKKLRGQAGDGQLHPHKRRDEVVRCRSSGTVSMNRSEPATATHSPKHDDGVSTNRRSDSNDGYDGSRLLYLLFTFL